MRKTASTNYLNETELVQCPLMHALTVLGNRWKPYILYKLRDQPLRFSEIKQKIPSISERMLILSLKELTAAELIHRKDYQQNPPKVEYSLTDRGKRLQPVLDTLCDWGKDLLG